MEETRLQLLAPAASSKPCSNTVHGLGCSSSAHMELAARGFSRMAVQPGAAAQCGVGPCSILSVSPQHSATETSISQPPSRKGRFCGSSSICRAGVHTAASFPSRIHAAPALTRRAACYEAWDSCQPAVLAFETVCSSGHCACAAPFTAVRSLAAPALQPAPPRLSAWRPAPWPACCARWCLARWVQAPRLRRLVCASCGTARRLADRSTP